MSVHYSPLPVLSLPITKYPTYVGLTRLKLFLKVTLKYNCLYNIMCIFKDKIFELNKINPAKCTEYDYINFLVASSRVFSCTEASKCSFIDSTSPAHDSFTGSLEDSLQILMLYGTR